MQTRPDHRRGEGYMINMLKGGWRANKDGEARAAVCWNDSGGRLDAEERAHGRGEHTGAGKGSDVDLGEWKLAMEIGWTS